MATWQKLILSGSDAQVTSLGITNPISGTSVIEVETGSVFLPDLPSLGIAYSLDAHQLMQSNVSVNGFGVYIKNPQEDIEEGVPVIIPWNYAAIDLNGDGAITSADLLVLLGAWGDGINENLPWGTQADLDQDGIVGAADLLIILSSFGQPLNPSNDTRPEITWNDSETYSYTNPVTNVTTGWVDNTDPSNPRVTVESVTALHTAMGDFNFWEMLPSSGTVQQVTSYITQMPSHNNPTLEIFLYIYFRQFYGETGDVSSTGATWKGGHNFYNRELNGPGGVNGYPG